MAGVLHSTPRTPPRSGKSRSSSTFDEGEWDGAKPSGLGVVKRSKGGYAKPTAAHHKAAKALVAKGKRAPMPDEIDDPQLREAYEQHLQADSEDYAEERRKQGYSDDGSLSAAGHAKRLGRGVKKTATATAGAGQAIAGAPGGGAINNGAGFLLGLLAYALVGAYLQGGTPEARQWLAAKFLNHAGGTSKNTKSQTVTPATPDFAGNADGSDAQQQAAAAQPVRSNTPGTPQ